MKTEILQGVGLVKMKAEIGVMQIKVKECQRLWANTRNTEGLSHRRAWPCQHLDFRFSPLPLNCEIKKFYCFRPSSLWCFITATSGNWYRHIDKLLCHGAGSVHWPKYEELRVMCCIFMWIFPNSIHTHYLENIRHSINISCPPYLFFVLFCF